VPQQIFLKKRDIVAVAAAAIPLRDARLPEF
jgi:hypothetical protein